MDLRCPSRKHAVVITPSANDAVVEVACPSRWCGKTEGVVVLHQFNIKTGALVGTSKFRQPRGEGTQQ